MFHYQVSSQEMELLFQIICPRCYVFDNWKDFPQISSWLRALGDLVLPSSPSSAVAGGHVYAVNQPLAGTFVSWPRLTPRSGWWKYF